MQIVLLSPAWSACSFPVSSRQASCSSRLTLLNAAMGLNQEGKAYASVAALQKMMVARRRSVARRSSSSPMEQIVPGDIVDIEAGDLVPADGRSCARRRSRSTSRP